MPWTYRVIDNKMEVYSGILTIKVPKLLKTKLYNNYWCILYTGRGIFFPRLDLYEEKTQVGQTPCKKTIYLEEAKWVKTDSLDPAFSFVVKHSKQYILVTACKSEVSLWIIFLCCISRELFDSKHIIGVEDLNKMDNYQIESGEEYVVKENILYSSSSELSTFVVAAGQIEACVQHGWKGLFKLRIGCSAVQLLQHDSEKEVASWPLMLLKKYGHTQRTFFFDAGSRSATGKGRFIFQTAQGDRITECLALEAQLSYNKSHRSDKSSVTEVSKQSVKFDAENIIRAKPPTLPQKPTSTSFRKSLPENTEFQGIHYPNGQQASKKIPAFGVEVFIPPAQQFSNERGHDYGVAPEDGKNTNREDVNDLPVNSADENNIRPLLKWSNSYQPSESGSTKEGKKAQKEWKREQKKREEEEKKERKRQEEEKKKEQKKREEEEKRIKKEQKKKQKEARRPSASSRSASLTESKVSIPGPEDFSTYTEVDINSVSADSSVFAEKIYSEPWGALPYLAVPPSGDGNEVEYAKPDKRPVHQTAAIVPREITHTEHYEAVQITEPEYSAPLVIPPIWEQTGDDSGTDVYSHLNEGKATVVQENLYGMASASPTVTVLEDENVYENTTDSPYECVGLN